MVIFRAEVVFKKGNDLFSKYLRCAYHGQTTAPAKWTWVSTCGVSSILGGQRPSHSPTDGGMPLGGIFIHYSLTFLQLLYQIATKVVA